MLSRPGAGDRVAGLYRREAWGDMVIHPKRRCGTQICERHRHRAYRSAIDAFQTVRNNPRDRFRRF